MFATCTVAGELGFKLLLQIHDEVCAQKLPCCCCWSTREVWLNLTQNVQSAHG
jgi:hypothetical protein